MTLRTTGMIGNTPKSQVWRVVVIEDSADDRAEIRRMLLNGSERRYKFVEAETGAEGLRAILDPTAGPPDCVVLDYALPDTHAVELLAALVGPDGMTVCPVVVLTGIAGHERSQAVLRAGAQDYLGKGWMTAESLTRVVENAAERFAMTRELSAREASLRVSEERFRLAARVAGLAIAEIDYATNQVRLAPESAALFGLPTDPPVVSRATIHALFHPDDRPALDKLIAASHDPAGTGEFAMDHRIIRPEGEVRWHSVRKQVFFEQARPARALLAMFDITDRKQAEEATRQNAILFAKIVEQAPGGVYVMDAQLHVREVNAEALAIFANVQPLIGRELGEVLGILWGPEIGRQCTEIFRHTLETGERYVSLRFDHLRQDISEEQAYEWETHRITLPDGQHGVVCYFQNVTQRESAAAALRKSEHFLKQIAEITPGVLHVFDLHEQRSVFINRTVASIMGYSPEEVAAMGREVVSILMHPDDHPHFASHLERLGTLRDDESAQFEHRMRAKSGEWRWFQSRDAVFERDASGAMRQIIGSAFDITERKLQETVLKASELRYRRLFETAKDGILILDTVSGRITDANPFMGELLGYSHEHFLGKELWEIGLYKDIVSNQLEFQILLSKGYVRYDDRPLLTKDGRHIGVEFVSNVYAAGEFQVIQCNIRDVTARKLVETELREAHANLEMRVRERTAQLGELNVALTDEIKRRENAESQRRTLQAQLTTSQEDERHRISRELHDQMGQQLTALSLGLKLVEKAVTQGSAIYRTIHDLQSLTEQMGREVHHLALELRPTALNDLGLQAAMANYIESWTERSGISVDFHCSGLDGVRMSSMIETALYRVVQESLTNILKHASAKNVSIVLLRSFVQVSAVIEDDGAGFALNSNSQPGKSTGRLGLLGMQERISLANGSMTIESEPGKGTSVIARIPLSKDIELG